MNKWFLFLMAVLPNRLFKNVKLFRMFCAVPKCFNERKLFSAKFYRSAVPAKRLASDFLQYKNQKGLFADFHSLRHTFITNLCRAKVPLATAQTLARHSTVELTANIYTHIDQQEQIDAINALPGW
jgi:integrase